MTTKDYEYQGLVVDVGEDVDYIDLMHIGDLHIGDANCDYDGILEVINWVNSDKTHNFITIGGDLFNAALANSKSDVYSETLDVDSSMDMFCKLFKSVAENVIAVVEGNHDRRVLRSVGVDPVKWCCNKLNIPYSHGESFVTLRVGNWDRNRKPDKKRSPVCYTVYMNHGSGGGSTPQSAIGMAAKRRDVVVADLYLLNHAHKPSATPYVTQEFDTRTGKIIKRQQYVVVSRGFVNRKGYPTEMGLAPVSSHNPIIRLDGHCKNMSATI